MTEFKPIQPIAIFPRLNIRMLQFVSENYLTHKELNFLLELTAISDRQNIAETPDSLSLHMQQRFETCKRAANEHLKKLRELELYKIITDRPNSVRGLPFLFNRVSILSSLWEYADINNPVNLIFGEAFKEWQTNGPGSKTLSSPSYARLTKRESNPARVTIEEHNRIVAELREEHERDMNTLKVGFTEVLEEQRRKSDKQLEEQRALWEDDRKKWQLLFETMVGELRKHDQKAAENFKTRHLHVVNTPAD